MMSKRAKYAIKALLYLYNHPEDMPIPAKTISEQERIPYKFLENILRELRQHRILKSERGADGGYRFWKDPAEITVKEILRIVDGPIALIPCVSEKFYEKCDECISEESCQIRKLFLALRIETLLILDKSLVELQELP